MDRLLITLWWFLAIAMIWQGLELLIYGQVQPRIVDDIIILLFLPFIWLAMK